MNLTIKGLKTWATDDGGGYQFTLYKDGKKCAFVHNDGHGGCLDYQWFDNDSEAKIRAFVQTLPDWEAHGFTGKMDLDFFIENLLEKYETEKWLNRQRKKGTLFRLISDPDSTIRVLKTFDMGKAKESLDRKYPNQYLLV